MANLHASAARAGGVSTIRIEGPAGTVFPSDGELHGFATPRQFAAEGYDPALVVTVMSLGGLAVGRSASSEGPHGDALGTSADGAIVDSCGSCFVFAVGGPLPFPTPPC